MENHSRSHSTVREIYLTDLAVYGTVRLSRIIRRIDLRPLLKASHVIVRYIRLPRYGTSQLEQ